jgi:hypothetical protein
MKARTKGSILVASALVAVIGSGAAVAGDGDPRWQQALQARSEALNEQYGLGDHAAATRSVASSESAWIRALRLRSEGKNQQFKLGEHAPRS